MMGGLGGGVPGQPDQPGGGQPGQPASMENLLQVGQSQYLCSKGLVGSTFFHRNGYVLSISILYFPPNISASLKK